MNTISRVWAREILDSRGNPTVEVDLWLSDGSFGRAAVPSGASTGSHEALELRDGQAKRYGGKGVESAVDRVNKTISPHLLGKNFDQSALDQVMIKLDGKPDKTHLGANAILGVSLAFSHAAAAAREQSLWQYFAELADVPLKPRLPVPFINIINGGAHAKNSTDIQEFMIVPVGAPNFKEALRWGAETFHALGALLAERSVNTNVGDEGGYAPSFASNETAIEAIMEAINRAGFIPGKEMALALDVAANNFYERGRYKLRSEFKELGTQELISLYADWKDRYPIISIEDGLMEDDWEGYKLLTSTLGSGVQIVGDDLFVTNINRLRYGIEHEVGNAILIKLNQIGTVSETIETIRVATAAGYKCIVSHRSGETEDTSIADLAVGTGVGQIKTGSTCRSERTAKYNQLLRIEEEMGSEAIYTGRDILPNQTT
jgi:enolase